MVIVLLCQVRCQVQELRVVLLQEGSASEDDIPEVRLELRQVRIKAVLLDSDPDYKTLP